MTARRFNTSVLIEHRSAGRDKMWDVPIFTRAATRVGIAWLLVAAPCVAETTRIIDHATGLR